MRKRYHSLLSPHFVAVGIILLLNLLPFTFRPLQAQTQRPKVGLVLSGGGAKGVAHIGALKVLEEAGIPIDYICGTSMGAIVGGLYAIGYDASELDSIVRAQDWMYLFSDRIDRTHRSYQSKIQNDIYLLTIPFNQNQKLKISQPTGIMKGQSILNKFSDLTLGYHDEASFDALPIPFACVSADLISGKEVVMRKGNLALAMRTSMSVPGFFEPVCKDSLVMIDGGVLNNFPVDVVKEMGADIVIGIDLSCDGLEPPKYSSLLDIANRLAFLSGEEKYERNKKKVDLYINPELVGFESVDFKPSAIDTMITMGETAGRKVWDDLMKLKKKLHLTAPYERPHRHLISSTDSLHLNSLHIEGLASYNEDWLKKKVGYKEGCAMMYADIENIVLTLQGLGLFKAVSYKVKRDENNQSNLFIYVEEKGRGSINIGMHVDTEEVASALLQTKVGFGEKNQHRISATTKINQNPWLNLSYSRNNLKMKSLVLTYNLSYKDFRLKKSGERLYNINYLRNHFRLNYKDYSFKNLRYETGIFYDIFSNVSDLFTPQYEQYRSENEDYAAAYFRIDYDTTDDRETPSRGINLTTNMTLYGNDIMNSKKSCFGALSFNIGGAVPLSKRFTLLPTFFGRFLIGNHIPGYFSNYMGGEYDYRYTQGQYAFYGVHFTEIMDNSMLGTRWALRYQLTKKHFLSGICNVLFDSHHIKDILNKRNHIGGAIKYTYNSMIGPISASIDYSSRSKEIGFFAGIGYFF